MINYGWRKRRNVFFGETTYLKYFAGNLDLIQGDADFKKLLQDEQNNLDRPSKGDGKGKEGKAGKILPSPS